MPERPTRLAMLKTGEADLATFMIGDEGAAVQRDPRLRLAVISALVTWWMEFPEQWDPASPWHDRRVRLAANLAIDKQAIIEVERLGFGRPTGSIIPSALEFALPLEPFPYDPAQARRLLAEAGYPQGFEAGPLHPLPPFFTLGEAVGNYLGAVGIRTQMRTMERAAFLSAWREKKLKGLILTGSGAFGNAATRIDSYGVSTGAYAYGGHPDIDALFQQQALEHDRAKREALLHQIQRLLQERVMHAPLAEPAALHGVGPRVEEPGAGLIPLFAYFGPYEDMRLKRP